MPARKPKAKRAKTLRCLPLSRPATVQDIVDKARQFGPACLDALADEVANNNGAPRILAANALLDRGYGKVGQSLEVTGANGGPLVINIVRFSGDASVPGENSDA